VVVLLGAKSRIVKVNHLLLEQCLLEISRLFIIVIFYTLKREAGRKAKTRTLFSLCHT
jgi:hypothetical protein